MNDYKQQILYYKLEDIFLDLFCYCYDKNINLEDIIYEINFDFDVFKLKHHKYIIKKIFKEELENNEELEKIFISYVKFYNKYKVGSFHQTLLTTMIHDDDPNTVYFFE